MRVYGESEFRTLNILNPGPRQRSVFNFKLRLLYSSEGVLRVNWTGSRVYPNNGLNTSSKIRTVCSKLELNQDPLDFPARSPGPSPADLTILTLRNRESRCLSLQLSLVLSNILNMIFRIFPPYLQANDEIVYWKTPWLPGPQSERNNSFFPFGVK